MSNLVSALLVVAAGMSVALQQVLNASLRVQIESPWWAGFVSYFVGCVAMLIVALFVSGPTLSLAPLSPAPSAWVPWIGGLFGAFFIAVVILMMPKLGAAYVLCLIVVGQMVGSMLFDHFGLFGLQQQSISLARAGGAALLVGGVILIRS